MLNSTRPTGFKIDPFKPAKATAKVGETIALIFTAKIDNGWYLYSSELKVKDPAPTAAEFVKNDTYVLAGKLEAIKPKEKYLEVWGGKVQYFEHQA